MNKVIQIFQTSQPSFVLLFAVVYITLTPCLAAAFWKCILKVILNAHRMIQHHPWPALYVGLLFVGRPAALALLASVMTLVITVVNNLTYFHRSPVAQTVYGKRDINVTFAGNKL